jgi:L-ribulose-5-phosphate 4-epimerase
MSKYDDIKNECYEANLLLPEFKLIDLTFGNVSVAKSLRPSSDTPTHCRLFQMFQGIRSIVHTHSRNAVAFAQAGKGIPCLGTTHADYFYGEVPVTRPMTAEEIQSAYDLRKHGTNAYYGQA